MPNFNDTEEAKIEQNFIANLQKVGYTYNKNITTLKQLSNNIKLNLERLNNVHFNKNEWERFEEEIFKIPLKDIDGVWKLGHAFQFDNVNGQKGEKVTIKFVDDANHLNNKLGVINQLVVKNDAINLNRRLDVVLTVNGLPLVSVELKNRKIDLLEGFNQIKKYRSELVYTGWLSYVKLGVTSNDVDTKYFALGTANKLFYKYAVKWGVEAPDKSIKLLSTLKDFTNTFLNGANIIEYLIDFVLYTNGNTEIIALRSYQYYGAKAIERQFLDWVKYSKKVKVFKGGYLNHSTASGKTITCAVGAKLIAKHLEIDTVIIAEDRNELEVQTNNTLREFDSIHAVSATTTKELLKALVNKERIIVTTEQKLGNIGKFVKNKRGADKDDLEVIKLLETMHICVIGDESHRGTSGKNYANIQHLIHNGLLYGMSGTPKIAITKKEEQRVREGKEILTSSIFGKEISRYTSRDAIRDNNILKLNYQEPKGYISTVSDAVLKEFTRLEEESKKLNNKHIKRTKKQIWTAFEKSDMFITQKAQLMINHIRVSRYKNPAIRGDAGENMFVGLCVTQDRTNLMLLLRKIIELAPDLNVTGIFSSGRSENDDVDGRNYKDERNDMQFVIDHYNAMFNTGFDLQDGLTKGTYKDDLAERVRNPLKFNKKDRIDLVIVVRIFTTGYDSKYFNTIFLDKNFDDVDKEDGIETENSKEANLIQTINRGSRVLGEVSKNVEIISFRPNKETLKNALVRFNGNYAYEDLITEHDLNAIIEHYKKSYKKLSDLGCLDLDNFDVNIATEANKASFVHAFNEFTKWRNVLIAQVEIGDIQAFSMEHGIIMPKELYDALLGKYKGMYDNERMREARHDTIVQTNQLSTKDFNMELIPQFTVDYDYITDLLRKLNLLPDDSVSMIDTLEELRQQIKNVSEGFIGKNKQKLDKFIEEYSGQPRSFLANLQLEVEKWKYEDFKQEALKIDIVPKYLNDIDLFGIYEDELKGMPEKNVDFILDSVDSYVNDSVFESESGGSTAKKSVIKMRLKRNLKNAIIKTQTNYKGEKILYDKQ